MLAGCIAGFRKSRIKEDSALADVHPLRTGFEWSETRG